MWNAIWIYGALVAKERPSVLKYFPVNSVQELARTMACCLKELALGGGGASNNPFTGVSLDHQKTQILTFRFTTIATLQL